MAVNMGNAVGYLDLDIAAFTAALAEAQQNADSTAKRISKSFENASSEIKKIGDSISGIGKKLTIGLTTPITAGVTASVKVLAEFEQTMSRVEALSGATADELELLSEKAQEMGAKTKYSANDAADAFTYMAQAGWDTQKMLDGIDGVMNLAASDGIALADASSIVTSSLTGFGLAASDAAHFADVLAIASSASNTDVRSLGESFKYVAPVAGAAGYSIEDIATALGVMANNGIVAGQAGTSLRAVISRLAAPTKLSRQYMEELGISISNADGSMKDFDEVIDILRNSFSGLTEAEQMFYAAEIFGQEAMTGVLSLINTSVDSYDELESAIYNSEGAAEEMAKTMQDNLLGRLEELSSAVESIAMSVGEIMMPAIENIVAKLQEWADRINSLDEDQKEMIVQIGLVVAAIGPAVTIVGKLVSVFGSIVGLVGKLTTGFSLLSGATVAISAPIVGIVAAIATLAAAFKTLWDNSESFRTGILEGWSTLKSTFATFINDITANLNVLGINWATVTNAIRSIWDGFCQALAPVFSTAWGVIVNVLSTVLNSISSVLGIFVNAFTGDWEGVWNNAGKLLYSIGQGIWNTAKSIFDGISGVWNNFIGPFQDAWEAAWIGIAGFFSSVLTTIADSFSSVITWIVDKFTYITEFVGWIAGKLGADWGVALNEWSKETREGLNIDIAGAITEGMDRIGTTIQTGLKEADGFFSAGWDEISGNIEPTDISDPVSDAVEGAQDALVVAGENAGTAVGEAFNESFQEAINGADIDTSPIEAEFKEVVEEVNDEVNDVTTNIVTKTYDVFGALSDEAGAVLQVIQAQYSEGTNAVMELWGSVTDYITQGYQQQIDALEKQIEESNEAYDAQVEEEKARYNEELSNLKALYANKEISDAEYQIKKNALEQQMANFTDQMNKKKEASELELKKKQDELARKQFESNKATEIANVAINLAAAIMKTYATSGWILGSIYAALLAAAAGAQIAAIASQKYVPMLAKGGIADSPTLGIFGEAGKEAIVPLERNTEWMDILEERMSNAFGGINGRAAYNITFNSPTTINEIQASRLMRRTIRDLAEGF